jgi:hypothetical protein
MSDATSIFGHYETESAMVRDLRLTILAILKETEDPTPLRLAELITKVFIIPLLTEFHE